MKKEPEIRIELEPSNYAKMRQTLIDFHYIPTLKEAKRLLGKLAGFIYAECDVGLRHFVYEFCNSPPYGDMWISPSDLLREECILKAPPTKRHMKDLNHEGAITMGWLIERKLLKHFDTELQGILDAQKKSLMCDFEKIIVNQIEDAIQREKDACSIESKQLLLSFDKKLLMELKDITEKIRKQNEVYTLKEDENRKCKWEAKIKAAVEESTKNITTQFLLELSRQEEEIALQFKGELMKQEMQRQFEINKEEAKFKQILQNVKHQLECKNIANMMYIMCMERHKCLEEREALEKYYKDELLQLSKTIYKDNEIIELLKNSICQEVQELKIRETCILEILKQYKEFISIALKGAPIHAKFLLSIEKLLLFELTETLAKLKPCKNTGEYLEGEITYSEESILTIEDLKAEKEVLESKKENAFVLEKKLYVKQIFKKFKDLLAETTGEPGDELWGEDAQLYIKALKESVPNIKLTESKLLQLSSTLFPDKSEKINPHRNSFVQFKLSQDSPPCSGLVKVEQIDEFTRKFKRRKKPLKYKTPIGDILSRIDYSQLGRQEISPSLLSTKNSLELLMQKGYHRNSQNSLKVDEKETHVRVAQEQEVQNGQRKKSSDINLHKKGDSVNVNGKLSLETRDSLILRQTSMARNANISFTCSPKDSIEVKNDSAISAVLRKQSSKLLETRDSVAYLKESKLALLTSGMCNICHQSESPSQVQDKDYCCKRCAKNKSFELVNGQLIKRELLEQDQTPKLVKLTHVDIIEREQKPKPNVVICSDISRPRDPSNTYRPSEKSKGKKRKSKEDPCQQLYSSFARVEGDATTNEHLQNNNEFTKDRVRSFIKLMDAHPNLIKLFTSCQQ